MNEALIGLAGALAGGTLTAIVNGWLAARARIAEELRGQRLEPARQQRSFLLSLELAWRHGRQSLRARRRLRKLRGSAKPGHTFRFPLP